MGGLPPLTDELHLLAEVWPACDLSATATKDAHQVTVIALLCALATATCIGYYFGRRAGSPRPSWRRRTSRVALGKLAISLLAMITARRIQQRFHTERMLSDVVGRWGLRVIAPVDVLRGGVARMRSY